MARHDDLGPAMGVGTDRGRRRHRGVPADGGPQECQGPHRVGRRRDCRPARYHYRLLVRQEIRAREGRRPAGLCRGSGVATGWLREIKSTLILQPGPAALTDGLDRLAGIITEWVENRPD